MNWMEEDKDIRDRFAELRAIDDKDASSFERDWRAAVSRCKVNAPQRTFRLKAAAAVSFSVIVVVLVLAVIYHRSQQPASVAVNNSHESPGAVPDSTEKKSHAKGVIAEAPHSSSPARRVTQKIGRERQAPKVIARAHRLDLKRTSVRLEQISEWRSPTDFLLRMPQDSLLNRVPDLRDSIITMRPLQN